MLDFDWELPSSLNAIQEAISNYLCVLHQLWPQDPSAMILQRVLVRHKWVANASDLSLRIALISDFFNAVLRLNASRASNRECVLSYEEQEKCLKDILRNSNVSPEVFGTNPLQKASKAPKSAQLSDSSAGASSTPRRPFSRPERQKAITGPNGMQLCFGFNNHKGCFNSKTSSGCKNIQGREFAHLCNWFMPSKGGPCFSQNHCRKNHSN